uniref:Tripartite motif-containing protein 16-like n=1 Tax=Erpetoichthys calabaricus TaxID=27687 RepID=A0A8C4SVP0_ERPCA
MAEAQMFVSQDEFTCSLCEDTLTDPVSIPCGHNFCLKCLTNYRDQIIKKLKKTTLSSPPPQNYLVDPDRNLKEKLCEKHQKSLEIFCKTDDSCICVMCVVSGHKNHEMVELETEREEKQSLQQIQTVLHNIKIRTNMPHDWLFLSGDSILNLYQMSVVREVEENEKSFTALMRCIEEAHRKLTERIREQEKREMEKAEEVMEQLEKEIKELKRREAELKELSETKDHLHFLPVTHSQISSLVFFSLLSDFCPLTLDINTAHRVLRLSEGNKKVTWEGTETEYPDHPDRFDYWSQVLCREALTGTRCYWEVECSGDVMEIGVANKGLSRKGGSRKCRLGYNDKSWCLEWSHSKYSVWHNNQQTVISAPYSPRIGVYLDWPAGSLSFYSVSHTMTLLHRFNTSFTEPLYPGFCLGLHCSVTISHLTPYKSSD